MQATTEAKISAGNWISLIVTMVVFAAGFLGLLGAAGGFGRTSERLSLIPGIAYCSDVCVPTDLNGIEIPMKDGQFVKAGISGSFGGQAVWSRGSNPCVVSGAVNIDEVKRGVRVCDELGNVYFDMSPWGEGLRQVPKTPWDQQACAAYYVPGMGPCITVARTFDGMVMVEVGQEHYGPSGNWAQKGECREESQDTVVCSN